MKTQQKPYRGILDATPLRQLTEDESKFLLKAVLSEQSRRDQSRGEPPIDNILNDHAPLKILYKRMGSMIPVGKVVTWNVLLMLAVLPEFDRPGVSVMWCYTLILIASEQGKPVNMDDFCTKVCPMGVPSFESLRVVWAAQKAELWMGEEEARQGSDNMLDRGAWWTPLIEKLKA